MAYKQSFLKEKSVTQISRIKNLTSWDMFGNHILGRPSYV